MKLGNEYTPLYTHVNPMIQPKILKVIIKAFAALVALFLIVMLVGIYKFNFTNDDIYVENEQGKLIKYDEYVEQEAKE